MPSSKPCHGRRILTVIGARPQFVKAALLSRALRKASGIDEIIVHTGQHYDPSMSAVFFRELGIPEPYCNLNAGGGSAAGQIGGMMKGLESLMVKKRPDLVLVYGDTNSTLAGALTAARLRIPVAHVEAGLRSFNQSMPEEVNRVVADHVSTLLFCPTRNAVNNLKKEGIVGNVFLTGDVMYESTLAFAKIAGRKSRILAQWSLRKGNYALATIHRAENTESRERLTAILTALRNAAKKRKIVLPLHPRTKKMIVRYGLKPLLQGITALGPVGFLDMICLEKNAECIITDSGGVQKEAYYHRVPCLTLRDETEWVETVKAGWNTLVDVKNAPALLPKLLDSLSKKKKREIPEYEAKNASKAICAKITAFLKTPFKGTFA